MVCCFRHSTQNNQQCFTNISQSPCPQIYEHTFSSKNQIVFFWVNNLCTHFKSLIHIYDNTKNSLSFNVFFFIYRRNSILHPLEWIIMTFFLNFSTLDCFHINYTKAGKPIHTSDVANISLAIHEVSLRLHWINHIASIEIVGLIISHSVLFCLHLRTLFQTWIKFITIFV